MLQGATESWSPNGLLNTASAVNSDQNAQGFFQSGIENLQGQKFPHLSGPLFQCLLMLTGNCFSLMSSWNLFCLNSWPLSLDFPLYTFIMVLYSSINNLLRYSYCPEKYATKNTWVSWSLRIAPDPINLSTEFCMLLISKHLNCNSFYMQGLPKNRQVAAPNLLRWVRLCSDALAQEESLVFLRISWSLGKITNNNRDQCRTKNPALPASSCSGNGQVACRRRVCSCVYFSATCPLVTTTGRSGSV